MIMFYSIANTEIRVSAFILPTLVLSPTLVVASPSPVRDHPTPVPEPALIPLTPSPATCRIDDPGDWQLLLLNLEGR